MANVYVAFLMCGTPPQYNNPLLGATGEINMSFSSICKANDYCSSCFNNHKNLDDAINGQFFYYYPGRQKSYQ